MHFDQITAEKMFVRSDPSCQLPWQDIDTKPITFLIKNIDNLRLNLPMKLDLASF
jgi:hypothetical protein